MMDRTWNQGVSLVEHQGLSSQHWLDAAKPRPILRPHSVWRHPPAHNIETEQVDAAKPLFIRATNSGVAASKGGCRQAEFDGNE